MEPVKDSNDGITTRPLAASPIRRFSPFSLLPDELIIAIATHLPQLKSFPAARERPWSMEQRSIEYFASVDERIRRLALSVRWEVRSGFHAQAAFPRPRH